MPRIMRAMPTKADGASQYAGRLFGAVAWEMAGRTAVLTRPPPTRPSCPLKTCLPTRKFLACPMPTDAEMAVAYREYS